MEAYDHELKRKCAIKIIKSIKKYTEASKLEIKVLEKLKAKDPRNLKQCIHLRDYFVYKNHVCMVFSLLPQSLFDYFEANQFVPFSLKHVQSFSRQILTSVAFLHGLGYIHTDIKVRSF